MSQYNYTNCIMQSFHHCLQLEKCAQAESSIQCNGGVWPALLLPVL